MAGKYFPPFCGATRNFSDIYQLQNSASSTYNGVSLTLNRQMSDELAFSASYTLSKTFDDASDFDEQPQNLSIFARRMQCSRQHQQQRFVSTRSGSCLSVTKEDKGGKSEEKRRMAHANVQSH